LVEIRDGDVASQLLLEQVAQSPTFFLGNHRHGSDSFIPPFEHYASGTPLARRSHSAVNGAALQLILAYSTPRVHHMPRAMCLAAATDMRHRWYDGVPASAGPSAPYGASAVHFHSVLSASALGTLA